MSENLYARYYEHTHEIMLWNSDNSTIMRNCTSRQQARKMIVATGIAQGLVFVK